MGLTLTVQDQESIIIPESHRIEVSIQKNYNDPKAHILLGAIREFYQLAVDGLQLIRVYTIKKTLSAEIIEKAAASLLFDPVVEEIHYGRQMVEGDWVVEVALKPGVTDNTGKIAQLTFEDFLKETFHDGESVSASTAYVFKGKLTREEIEKVATGLLANPLIEEIAIHKANDTFSDTNVHQTYLDIATPPVETIPLIEASPEALKSINKQRHLALNLQEMQVIQAHFAAPSTTLDRSNYGLPANPTDVELEVFAQTWSEHCKHKIFNARIKYTEDGKEEQIDSLFSTYIKKATTEISRSIDWLVSVFTDNAGIIKYNDKYVLSFKVETHNSPSALDPFGGALTGILGVNRDIMGAGIGSRLLANTDILCFAPPNYSGIIPERLMHPRRIMEGVCRGIEQGGNKSGIPTVNGSVLFDDRFLGKPLVYCGSVGIMPAMIRSKASHVKEIAAGDLIVIAGGRTGKDGIHGATFSSEALHANSPSTAVQIGDPFTQKKLHDFLLEARDAGLYRTLTDNGAGGFSSSVGELATLCGGCEMHLDRAQLKQPGLAPWEILISESQERMTLAVPPENKEMLFELAKLHEVELVDLGNFTGSGYFHVLHHDQTVALLDLDFLHNGLPQMCLEAEWHLNPEQPCLLPCKHDYTEDLHTLLSRFNICSKESIVRQYDHEVQGGSVIKPFVGIANDGPGDAGVICPIETASTREGVVIGHGICPRYSDDDAYHMTANAIDEAIRNCVAVGGDPDRIAILDNFCWPDPVYDAKENPDGKEKLAQLVRSNKALYSYAKAFMAPIISGKDSMKNDYKIGNVKISVPPTLLISAIGKINDVAQTVTMDVKFSGDLVYVLGTTKNEMGRSEYTAMKNIEGGSVPVVDAKKAKALYSSLHKAIQRGLVTSCHDCSEGGLAVALSEKAFAGGLGMEISLKNVPVCGELTDATLLFSESASRFVVTINPEQAKAFEQYFHNDAIGFIGTVRNDTKFLVKGTLDNIIIDTDLISLKTSWQTPLKVKS